MMDKITEIIPDDIPEWARKAMDEGQLWNKVFERIEELEARIEEYRLEHNRNTKDILALESTVDRLHEIESREE